MPTSVNFDDMWKLWIEIVEGTLPKKPKYGGRKLRRKILKEPLCKTDESNTSKLL